MGSNANDVATPLTEADASIPGRVVDRITIPPRDGEFVSPESVLPPSLADPLVERIGDLYSHQATALATLADGEDVCVTTPTASGKTLVYALEFARRHQSDSDATGLVITPTKALARDQRDTLSSLFIDLGLEVSVRVYDGDTPSADRPAIREAADLVITNFVGLNEYLGHHSLWRRILSNCSMIAIDEAHSYTGLYGMHVAWTVRRLRRLLSHYGADPRFICTSATIGNPADHAQSLTGRSVTVVAENGAPRGERTLLFWDPIPPNEDCGEPPATVAGRMVARLGWAGVRSLAFATSRTGAELGAAEATDRPSVTVEPYHAGLGPTTRRGIEHHLANGHVDGLVATTALELGIDIGSIDATILGGYPGSRGSFWQQVGRSGRGAAPALSVFVPGADALDRFVLDHPDHVTGEPIEDAVVGLSNNAVYAQHVLAAAHERPLTSTDRSFFDGERLDRAVSMWVKAGRLAGDLDRGVRYTGPPRPQAECSMFAGDDPFMVTCRDGEIDMAAVDRSRAYRDYHPGALFLHNGERYQVIELVDDPPTPTIVVQSTDIEAYTQTLSEKTVQNISAERSTALGDGYRLRAGTGNVEIYYTASRRRSIETGRPMGPLEPIDGPPITIETDLMWIETSPDLRDRVRQYVDRRAETDDLEVFGGGLHGAEHGMIKLAPLVLRLDPGDLGGLSTPRHGETGVPTWFIHDAVDGGLGFSHRLYERTQELAERTRGRVAACGCTDTGGCPGCIMDAQCGNQNRFLHTGATVAVLDAVLERF